MCSPEDPKGQNLVQHVSTEWLFDGSNHLNNQEKLESYLDSSTVYIHRLNFYNSHKFNILNIPAPNKTTSTMEPHTNPGLSRMELVLNFNYIYTHH